MRYRHHLRRFVVCLATAAIVSFSGSSLYGQTPPSLSYPFSEGSGASTTDVANQVSAALYGGVTWTTGQDGTGLSFDGSDDHLSILAAPALDVTTAFTIEAWVYQTTNVGMQVIAHRPTNGGAHYYLLALLDGHLVAGGGTTAGESWAGTYTVIPLNRWTHIAATWDGTTVRTYINGVAGETAALGGTIIATNDPLALAWHLAGSLDEVRLYHRALSASEIVTDMQAVALVYPFSEGSGVSTTDVSTNHVSAALNGGVSWTTGRYGSALSFDGTDDHVTVTPAPALEVTTAFTLEAWVYQTSNVGSQVIARRPTSGGAHYYLLALWDGHLVAGGKTTTGEAWAGTTSTIPLNQWTHVAATWDGTTVRTYINGVADTTAALGGTIVATPDPMSLGWHFAGRLDEVRLYHRALAPAEIVVDMQAVALAYPFSEGSGVTTTDVSANQVNAALYGGVGWTTGRYGSGLSFDGNDDHLWIPPAPALDVTTAFTLEAWVYQTSRTGFQLIAHRPSNGGGHYYLLALWDGYLMAGGATTTGEEWAGATSEIPLNQWTHVAATWDGTTVRTYINGVADTTVALTGTIVATPDPLFMGWALAGHLDEVRLYDRALSPAEIVVDMNTPIPLAPILSAGTIDGTVTSTSMAIAGATVDALQNSVVQATTSTSSSGTYALPNLTAGSYDVRASATQYLTATQTGVTVMSGATTTTNFSLVPVPSISSLTPSAGPIGQAVTLAGANFGTTQGNSTVTFNGVAAMVTGWSVTSIGVTVPTGATTGPVMVTVGGQASAGVTFTVLVPPNITGLNPTSGSVGQTGTISGTNFGAAQGTSTVTFNHILAPVTGWSDTTITTAVPLGAGTGPVVVTVAGQASNAVIFTSTTPDGNVRYVYDELGRLASVIDSSGETATYVYDAVGNLLAITRASSSTVVKIVYVAPQTASEGSAVTISGTGFSATSSQNTVTFNGIPATVTSATPTQLVVTVPSGATTGSIAVTSPAGSASSGSTFTVVASLAPLITGFFPAIGTVLTPVTISGANFDPVAIGNVVRVNLQLASLTAASVTSLEAPVPLGATSGRLTVRTVHGLAISSSDFFAPPTPFTASDVLVATRLTVGGSATMGLTTPDKIALVVFDGIAGQRVAPEETIISGGFGCGHIVRVNQPNGNTIVSAGICSNPGLVEPLTLPVTGTYTILIDPVAGASGTVTLNLYNVVDVTTPITVNGPAVQTPLTTPGQKARLPFTGSAGQRVSVKVTLISGGFNCGSPILIRKASDDTVVGSAIYCSGGVGFLEPVTLPSTGSYLVEVDPLASSTGTAQVNLYDVMDTATPITASGPAVDAALTTPGQRARLPFTGSAEQRVSVKVTLTSGGFNCGSPILIRKASDDTVVGSAIYCSGGVGFLEPVTLPSTGSYLVEVDPLASSTGTAQVNLYDVVDVTTPITPNGSAVAAALTTPGQRALLPFAGTGGQQVTVVVTLTSGGFSCGTVVELRKAADSSLVANTGWCGGTSKSVGPVTLPESTNYLVVVDPAGVSTGTADVTLTLP